MGNGWNKIKGGRLGENNNPGGAHWCTEPTHMRLECTKFKKKRGGPGERCHARAVRGTNACKMHSGFSVEVAKARGEATITAWNATGRAVRPVSASASVLGMLQQSWLRAHAYGELLRRSVAAEGGEDLNVEYDGHTGEIRSNGLIGHRYGMGGKEGILYRQSEEIRALVKLESEERDRVVRFAKVAHDMGISERLTGLAEQWGDLVAVRISGLLDELALSPEQAAKVPALLHAHLGTIDLVAIGSGGGVETYGEPE